MDVSSVHTAHLHKWIHDLRAGNAAAREELCHRLMDRLERLSRKMLRAYPKVRQVADTGDVLQNAMLRLLRSLEDVKPESMRDFFGLAAEHMRRELLDLARRWRSTSERFAPIADSSADSDLTATAEDRSEVEKWSRFHDGVAGLPAEEREVVGLIFYHGWTQIQVAELFQVNERTVRRWWVSAMMKLKGQIEGD